MIKLIDILNLEAKQVGILYHFTNIGHIPDILKSGLRFDRDNSSLPQYSNKFFISATRSHNFGGGDHFGFINKAARITLDGNKISNKYSVVPINADNIWDKKYTMKNNIHFDTKKGKLFEERIYSNERGFLSLEYFIKIDILNKGYEYEMFKDLLPHLHLQSNVQINFVDSYNKK